MRSILARLAMVSALFAFVSPLPLEASQSEFLMRRQIPSFRQNPSTSAEGHIPPLPKVVPHKEPDYRPWQDRLNDKLNTLTLSVSDPKRRASTRSMERLIKSRPSHGIIDNDVRAITAAPATALDYPAIRLPPGERQGSQALAEMTRKYNSFYAEDNGGRVWLFNAYNDDKGRKYFTYHGSLRGGNDDLVRDKLRAAYQEFDRVEHSLDYSDLKGSARKLFHA